MSSIRLLGRLAGRALTVATRSMARRPIGRARPPSSGFGEIVKGGDVPPPASVPEPSPDPWTEVKDPKSGQIYYWNQSTNETTALGAPKPSAVAPQESMASTLGRTVAEGFAFGVGSSIARSVVGSMFGGFGGSDDGALGDSGESGGFDEEEI